MVEKNKLKNIIKEEINELKLNDTLDTIIFTTYSFDTLFFETQLLPYLFDIPNYKSIKNRSRFIAIDLNEKIKTNIKVYYDHLVGEYESTVRYRASKKIIENGIFHPKLIILIGKKTLKVIVLSANLTTSSYGINQEVLGSIKVDSNTIQKIEKEIGNKLSLENDIKKILTALNNNIDDLIITGLDDNKLTKYIKDDTKMTIITPFLSNTINKKYKNATILLTDKTSLKKTKNLDTHNIYLYESERYIHAKIYLLEELAIIGSHNFTDEAINGKNIEASIIIREGIKELKKEYPIPKNTIDINDLEEEESKTKDNEENNLKEIEIKEALIDYKNSLLKITLDKDYNNVIITQLGLIKTKPLKMKKNNHILYEYIYEYENDIEIEDIVCKNKYFEIEIDEKYKGEGIFYETETPKEILFTSNDYFERLDYYINNSLKQDLDFNFKNKNNDSKNESNFENIYSNTYDIIKLFKAYKTIKSKFENKENFKELNRFINSFLNFYKKTKEEINDEYSNDALLYLLLTSNELINLSKGKKIDKNINEKLNTYFRELKKLALKKLKNDLELDDNFLEKLLNIYLDYLKEVKYEE